MYKILTAHFILFNGYKNWNVLKIQSVRLIVWDSHLLNEPITSPDEVDDFQIFDIWCNKTNQMYNR